MTDLAYPVLNNFTLGTDFTKPGTGTMVCGDISGHSTIPDGTRVVTPPIIMREVTTRIITTGCGCYVLGTPHPEQIKFAPETEERFWDDCLSVLTPEMKEEEFKTVPVKLKLKEFFRGILSK